MTFYFFAPLLCLLHKKHFVYLLVFLGITLTIFIEIGQWWHYLNHNPGRWFYPANFVIGATFPGRFTEFLAGIVLSISIKNGKTNWLQKIPYKTALGFAGIFITAYIIGLFQPDRFHHGADHSVGRLIQYLVVPFFTMLALAGLIQEKTFIERFFSTRGMILLGNASFAFYLVHISYVNLKIKSWVLLPDRNFVLLWLVSILLYLLFEKPIYEIGKKWVRGRQGNSYRKGIRKRVVGLYNSGS